MVSSSPGCFGFYNFMGGAYIIGIFILDCFMFYNLVGSGGRGPRSPLHANSPPGKPAWAGWQSSSNADDRTRCSRRGSSRTRQRLMGWDTFIQGCLLRLLRSYLGRAVDGEDKSGQTLRKHKSGMTLRGRPHPGTSTRHLAEVVRITTTCQVVASRPRTCVTAGRNHRGSLEPGLREYVHSGPGPSLGARSHAADAASSAPLRTATWPGSACAALVETNRRPTGTRSRTRTLLQGPTLATGRSATPSSTTLD